MAGSDIKGLGFGPGFGPGLALVLVQILDTGFKIAILSLTPSLSLPLQPSAQGEV